MRAQIHTAFAWVRVLACTVFFSMTVGSTFAQPRTDLSAPPTTGTTTLKLPYPIIFIHGYYSREFESTQD